MFGLYRLGGTALLIATIFQFLIFFIVVTKIVGSYKLELKCNGDRTFLNFWDSAQGNDVCVQLVDNKLMQYIHSTEEIEDDDFEGNSIEQKEISLQEFIQQIEESIKSAGSYYSH